MARFIAYDLGTGGIKASLYDEALHSKAGVFIEYSTYYDGSDRKEQRPLDWWDAVCESTKQLLKHTGTAPRDIACVAISGQSLVSLPVDERGEPLLERVPIWSDTRASAQSERFFQQVSRDDWYMTTGNGFPPACYSLFKIMWMKEHFPELYNKTHKFLGSKDYINFCLTGEMRTDFSYASGTGGFSLKEWRLWQPFLDAAGIERSLFPDMVPSYEVIGRVTVEAAQKTGLMAGTPVACGAVDNACMALGAVGTREGGVYVSLGSSSWIPVNSREPVLDPVRRSYVFAHAEKGMYTSAFSIFSAGSSLRWARETLCGEFAGEEDAYDRMTALAAKAPLGAGGVLFNPSLAGGTSQDKSVHIRGAYLNLTLGAAREDLIRAVLEGIALNLRASLLYLREHTRLSDRILFCGGGARSPFWMQMFADVFNMSVVTTNIDQDAASLGAAAIAKRAAGEWGDFSGISALHTVRNVYTPDAGRHAAYLDIFRRFILASDMLSDLGDRLREA